MANSNTNDFELREDLKLDQLIGLYFAPTNQVV
jgi:hypothetical protein